MVIREIQNFWQKWTHLHQAFTHRNGKFLKKQWFSDIFMTFIAIPVIIVVIWRLSLNTNLTVASFWYHSVQQGIFWAEDDLEFRIWPQITGYSIENVQTQKLYGYFPWLSDPFRSRIRKIRSIFEIIYRSLEKITRVFQWINTRWLAEAKSQKRFW